MYLKMFTHVHCICKGKYMRDFIYATQKSQFIGAISIIYQTVTVLGMLVNAITTNILILIRSNMTLKSHECYFGFFAQTNVIEIQLLSHSWLAVAMMMALNADPMLALLQIDGLMQKRPNSSANALELHLFCIKPSRCYTQSVFLSLSMFHHPLILPVLNLQSRTAHKINGFLL